MEGLALAGHDSLSSFEQASAILVMINVAHTIEISVIESSSSKQGSTWIKVNN